VTFGSLFAGIGGLDLGLERAGMRCVWQVEIDDYCRRVLAKHWPDVRRHDDVRTFPPGEPDDWRCDLIAGGFPCQDVSLAGRRAGINGERSGLWAEFARIIRDLRPRFVLVENVPGLLTSGLGRVLGDLATLGFDAEWDCLSASSVGAPHIRERVFLVAYAGSERRQQDARSSLGDEKADGRAGRHRRESHKDYFARRDGESALSHAEKRQSGQLRREQFAAFGQSCRDLYWPQAEPPVCGVADGVPSRVDRLKGLGNAVVPQVAEWIGRRITEVATR
jgi:DNA (cytosine-5)-methyltransferase 1